MALPEQVRLQAERANQLLAQAHGEAGKPEAQTPAPEPAPQEPQVDTPENNEPQSQAPAPEQKPAPAPAAAAPATPDDDPNGDSWRQRYKTLQGLMNAESGRWSAEKQTLSARLTALEAALAEAKAQAPAPAPAPAAPAPLVTDKDIETYGPELMDVIGRKAAEMAQQIVAQEMGKLKPELDKVNQTVGAVATQAYKSSEEKFYGELTREVPDWKEVNSNQAWLAWLGEIDPLSGVPRQVYLDNAAKNMDHARTAALFNAFKDSAGLNKPAEPAAPAKPQLSPSPRTVGTASAPTPREPQTSVTRSEIAAHYRRGATDTGYRGSKEHAAMEARIADAMATGRVVEA